MTPTLLVRNALVAIGIATAAMTGLDRAERPRVDPAPRTAVRACSSDWTPAEPLAALPTPALRGPAASATVALTVDARGRVVDAAILERTGTATSDRAALRVARSLTFAPETADCRPVSGSYVAAVRFDR